MHANILDVYQPRDSVIHRLDPRVKLLGSLFIILTTVLLPEGSWASQAALLLILLSLNHSARLGLSFTMQRAFIAIPFILAALPLPFLTPGPPAWVLPGLEWVATTTGIIRFLTILVRTWIAVQAGIFLSATTAMSELLWGLRALRVPQLIISIVGFMIRYLFVLMDEALRMLRARTARSPRIASSHRPSLIWQGRAAGMMVGSLFVRSLERSERVYAAILSRGYDGEMRVLHRPIMGSLDWMSLVGILIALSATIALAVWS